jgi:hypothetical protein
METLLRSFEEFWPCYVGQHMQPENRALHFVGTTLALSALAGAVKLASPVWLLAVPVAGYGPAWVGHFFFEKNRPATFRYPLWSPRGAPVAAASDGGRSAPEEPATQRGTSRSTAA